MIYSGAGCCLQGTRAMQVTAQVRIRLGPPPVTVRIYRYHRIPADPGA